MAANYHSNIRHDILALVPAGGRLLDVGGGTGATALHLKEIGRAREVGVIDAVAPSPGDGLDFASNLDLTDAVVLDAFLSDQGLFDTVLFLDVLEHLPDPWATVDHFVKHIRPGGVAIASIPNVHHYTVVWPLLFRDQWLYQDAGILDRTHLRFFTRESAAALLGRAGLHVEQVIAKPPGRRRDRMVNAATLGLLRPLFTYQYIIIARRYDRVPTARLVADAGRHSGGIEPSGPR